MPYGSNISELSWGGTCSESALLFGEEQFITRLAYNESLELFEQIWTAP